MSDQHLLTSEVPMKRLLQTRLMLKMVMIMVKMGKTLNLKMVMMIP